MRRLIGRIAVDTRGLKESRDFRLLTIGSVITGLGTQAALVALPYQVYVISGSAFLTGLLGAVELGPLIALSLFGGALADRFDRRRLLLAAQVALVLVASGLGAGAGRGGLARHAAAVAPLRAGRPQHGCRGCRARHGIRDGAEPGRPRTA